MDEAQALLRQVSFADGIGEETLVDLAAIAHTRRVAAGELIQVEGEPAAALYVVATGRVRVYRVSARGREQVLHVLGPTDHFNHVPIFDGGPCPANAEAVVAGLLLVLPADELRTLVSHHADLAMAFLTDFAGKVRHLVGLVDALSLQSVQSRLASLLLEQAEAARSGAGLASQPGQSGQSAQTGLTQTDMAARLGTVREMVGRSLKSFREQGLIALDRGEIIIVDRRGLQALVEE